MRTMLHLARRFASSEGRNSLSFRSRMIISFGFVLAFTVMAMQLLHMYGVPFTKFSGELADRKSVAFAGLSLVADLKQERLVRWLDERRDDVLVLANSEVLESNVARIRDLVAEEVGNGADRERMWQIVRDNQAHRDLIRQLELVRGAYGGYKTIRVVDAATKTTIASTDSDELGGFVPDLVVPEYRLEPAESNMHLATRPEAGSAILRVYKDVGPPEDAQSTEPGVVAILLADIDLEDMIVPLLHTGGGLGDTGEVVLVDQDARILTSLLHPLSDGTEAQPLEYRIEANPAVFAARGEGGIIASNDYRNEPVLAAYRYIPISPEAGWGMVVKQDEREIFRTLRQNLAQTSIIGLSGTILALALAVFVATTLARPIRNLLGTVRRIEQGDLRARASAKAPGEFGPLALAFNSMAERVEQSNAELERQVQTRTQELVELGRQVQILADIGRTINSSLDIEQVYEAFTEQVAQLVQFDMIAIIGVDTERQMYGQVFKSGINVPEPRGAEERKLTGSVTEFVIRSGRAIVVDLEGSEFSRAHMPTTLREVGLRCLVAAPLVSGGQPIGALHFASTHRHAYSEQHRVLAERVANQIAGAVANARLYEELQRAVDDAQESEQLYRLLADNAADVIFVRDLDMKLLYISPSVERLRGYSVEEMLALPVEQTLPPESLETLRTVVEAGLEKSREGRAVSTDILTIEAEIFCKDGSTLWGETMMRILYDAGGTPTSVLGVTRDITLRRRAEARLRLNTAALESAANAVMITDVNGTIDWVNPAFVELTGYSEDEAVGNNLAILQSGKQDAAFFEDLWATVSSGSVWTGEIVSRNKRGDLWTSEQTITPVRDTRGRITHFVGIMQDITERKIAEQKLIESSRLASVGELAAGFAHEINNPVAVVLGFAELVLSEDLPPGVEYDVRKMQSEAKRASAIVNNLLSFARRRESSKRPTDIPATVQRALELKSYDFKIASIESANISEPEVPYTLADENQLVEVLLNLLNNAQHATQEVDRDRKITVLTSYANDVITISVSDNGAGIPPEVLPRIFEPFFTTKAVGQGTGLGLSICHGIIAEHGGQMWAENNADEGATVTVRLPVLSTGEEPVPPAADSSYEAAPGLSILAIDDEPNILEVLETQLELAGHKVDTAHDGLSGWEKIQRNKYDCILLDLRMPNLNGQELYGRIFELDPVLARRVVFVTGDSYSADAYEFVIETGNPLLSKPFTQDELMKQISRSQEFADGRSI